MLPKRSQRTRNRANERGRASKASQTFRPAGEAHELTFSCYGRRPLLDDDSRKRLFLECVDKATERQGFGLLAYVLMPEHVHLLVLPLVPTARISALLSDIKRPFSWKLKRDLLKVDTSAVDELTIRQRPGVTTFRFWQEGGGYDRNLTEARTIIASIEYIHQNPVRRGLCARAVDWPWSSASRLLLDDIAALQVSPRLHRYDVESGQLDSPQ